MSVQLSDTQLFLGLTEKEITTLLQCLHARQKMYRKGEIILSEGKPTRQMGIVLSGMAVISSSDVWGVNSILGSASPGTVFAEAYACSPGEPLMISVYASEDTSVLFLDIHRVLSSCTSACRFHARLIRNLLTVCASKNLQLSRRILHTSSKSIRGRLLSYFSECVKKTGSLSFEIPYSRQQLADYLSVDRSALSNELSKMQKDGLIQYHRNHVSICDTCAKSQLSF